LGCLGTLGKNWSILESLSISGLSVPWPCQEKLSWSKLIILWPPASGRLTYASGFEEGYLAGKVDSCFVPWLQLGKYCVGLADVFLTLGAGHGKYQHIRKATLWRNWWLDRRQRVPRNSRGASMLFPLSGA